MMLKLKANTGGLLGRNFIVEKDGEKIGHFYPDSFEVNDETFKTLAEQASQTIEDNMQAGDLSLDNIKILCSEIGVVKYADYTDEFGEEFLAVMYEDGSYFMISK